MRVLLVNIPEEWRFRVLELLLKYEKAYAKDDSRRGIYNGVIFQVGSSYLGHDFYIWHTKSQISVKYLGSRAEKLEARGVAL